MKETEQLDILLRCVYRILSFHPEQEVEKIKKEMNNCPQCRKNSGRCPEHVKKMKSAEEQKELLKNNFPIRVKKEINEALMMAQIEIPDEYKH